MSVVTYRARAGTTSLPLIEGDVMLDSTRAPHVTATLATVATRAVLDAVDPRQSARVVLEVVNGSTVVRAFNLGVVRVSRDVGGGQVAVELASDEALLQRWAPLVDDVAPYDLSSSVASIVNYVLGKAAPGAQLAVSSQSGAVTPVYDVSNLLLNPNAVGSAANWSATNANLTYSGGAGFNGVAGYIQAALTAAQAQVRPVASAGVGDAFTVRPGEWYTANTHARTPDAGVSARMRIRWVDDRGNAVGDTAGALSPLSSAGFTRLSVTSQAPLAATRGFPYAAVEGANGKSAHFDAAMFHQGRFPVAYFDGASANTPTYSYAWSGTANASGSTRTALVDGADPDSLVWSAGQSAMDFLSPLIQSVGLRLVCDEARSWTLRNAAWRAAGSLDVRFGVNLIDASEVLESGDEWFDAAVIVYKWQSGGVAKERVDTYASQTPYIALQRIERATPYPGKGFAQYAVQRAQGRGRVVTVEKVADWAAVAEQSASFVLPEANTQNGIIRSVRFDLTSDRMVVESRTVELPPGAWLLLPSGQRWTDSPAGASWTGEAV